MWNISKFFNISPAGSVSAVEVDMCVVKWALSCMQKLCTYYKVCNIGGYRTPCDSARVECFWSVSQSYYVSVTSFELLHRISWNFVVIKDTMYRWTHYQETIDSVTFVRNLTFLNFVHLLSIVMNIFNKHNYSQSIAQNFVKICRTLNTMSRCAYYKKIPTPIFLELWSFLI